MCRRCRKKVIKPAVASSGLVLTIHTSKQKLNPSHETISLKISAVNLPLSLLYIRSHYEKRKPCQRCKWYNQKETNWKRNYQYIVYCARIITSFYDSLFRHLYSTLCGALRVNSFYINYLLNLSSGNVSTSPLGLSIACTVHSLSCPWPPMRKNYIEQ